MSSITTLSDAILTQVSGGQSDSEQVQPSRNKRTKLPSAPYDYGNMIQVGSQDSRLLIQ